MNIDDKIRDEKLQYDVNREAKKIWALSSSKVDEYEYLTCREILTCVQSQVIEQAKFSYSPLGKAFEKQTIKGQGEKHVKAIVEHNKKTSSSFTSVKNGGEPRSKFFLNLVAERIKEIAELIGEIDYTV